MNEGRTGKCGTYPWSFVTQIFHNGQPCYGGDRKTFAGTFGSAAYLLGYKMNEPKLYMNHFWIVL
jgi:hypothetical protein